MYFWFDLRSGPVSVCDGHADSAGLDQSLLFSRVHGIGTEGLGAVLCDGDVVRVGVWSCGMMSELAF